MFPYWFKNLWFKKLGVPFPLGLLLTNSTHQVQNVLLGKGLLFSLILLIKIKMSCSKPSDGNLRKTLKVFELSSHFPSPCLSCSSFPVERSVLIYSSRLSSLILASTLFKAYDPSFYDWPNPNSFHEKPHDQRIPIKKGYGPKTKKKKRWGD